MPTINKPKRKSSYVKHTDLSQIYKNSGWKKLRKAYFMSHPLCEMCLSDNKISQTEEVHHIIPVSTAKDELNQKDLLLNESNLIALCKYHHHKVHNEMKKGRH